MRLGNTLLSITMEVVTTTTAQFPPIISLPMAETSRRVSVATISSCAAEAKQLLVSNQTQNKVQYTKQSAIYKTKCNVLNCLLYTRAPDPHMHIQHMHNQHTHIFPPHACRRLWLQNSFIDPDKTKHPCIWHILSASCRRKGFFFSATFMDIPSRKMPSCMAVVAQATR